MIPETTNLVIVRQEVMVERRVMCIERSQKLVKEGIALLIQGL